jgi:hypothetical protein
LRLPGAAVAIACALAGGCSRSAERADAGHASEALDATSATATLPHASRDASDASASSGAKPVNTPPPPTAAELPCRVLDARGSARLVGPDAPPLVARATVEDDAWMVLEEGARATLKDAKTLRELTYFGPGRVVPCARDRADVVVMRGGVESAPGAGETAGREVWIATPLAAVRFTFAHLRVDVFAPSAEADVVVRVESGTAHILSDADTRSAIGSGVRGASGPPDAGTPSVPVGRHAGATPKVDADGFRRIASGERLTLSASSRVTPDVRAEGAVDRCEKAADRTKALAARLAEDFTHIGEIAPEHVTARLLAHGRCAIARASLARMPDGKARDALLSRVAAADARWRSL